MDATSVYSFDVRGYTILPAVLNAEQLAVLNAEVCQNHDVSAVPFHVRMLWLHRCSRMLI